MPVKVVLGRPEGFFFRRKNGTVFKAVFSRLDMGGIDNGVALRREHANSAQGTPVTVKVHHPFVHRHTPHAVWSLS
jgi:hypothetical protein